MNCQSQCQAQSGCAFFDYKATADGAGDCELFDNTIKSALLGNNIV